LQDKVNGHNVYLQILTERGALGLALFLIVLGLIIIPIVRAATRPAAPDRRRDERWLALALAGGFTALLLDGLFQYIFYVYAIECLFWLMAGLGTTLAVPGELPPAAPAGRRAGRWAWWVALPLLAGAIGQRHYGAFIPWNFPIQGQVLKLGGRQVLLYAPDTAHQVRLHLGTLDPALAQYPLTITVATSGVVLHQETFHQAGQVELTLPLPDGHRVEEPVILTASRTWSPWRYGARFFPFLEMGVMFRQD
jgi:hypothetical protein